MRAWLASPLPLDPTVPDSVPAVLGHPCEELKPLSAKALGAVLLDPQTDPGVLKTIKDYCKHLSVLERSEPRHAVAITGYYAATASALVFHTKRITRHSYGSLDRSFAMLTDKPWMSADLAQLFAKARHVCQAEERRSAG